MFTTNCTRSCKQLCTSMCFLGGNTTTVVLSQNSEFHLQFIYIRKVCTYISPSKLPQLSGSYNLGTFCIFVSSNIFHQGVCLDIFLTHLFTILICTLSCSNMLWSLTNLFLTAYFSFLFPTTG